MKGNSFARGCFSCQAATLSRQYSCSIFSTSTSSSVPTGSKSCCRLVNIRVNCSLPWPSIAGSPLETKPCRVLFQELIALPQDVFGPVDFFAFPRLASIFRCEDPFDGIASVCVDSASVASAFIDSAGCDSDRDSADLPSGKPLFS